MSTCICDSYSEDRGGGHYELMLEPNPDCPEHFPKETMSKRWYVHIQGPDDMEPADGMLDAMQKAHAFNTGAVRWLEARTEGPYTPLAWAIPIRPGDPATAHITADETETH